jgi:hypothetical protein
MAHRYFTSAAIAAIMRPATNVALTQESTA